MLRSEVQEKTGLTRKAIEYYEEKGLVKPLKLENGYRDYTDEDLKLLNKIGLLRKVGLSIFEIEECLFSNENVLHSMLRRKEHQIEIEQKRKEIIELIVKNVDTNLINDKIALIEAEECIYQRLEKTFPGYFGQLIFSAYQPFLNEPLTADGISAYQKYVEYLDNLPSFKLSKEEMDYVEELTSCYDMRSLKEINNSKIEAIENAEKWFVENKDTIDKYQDYKNSDEYKNSPMQSIQEKLKTYMIENNYYETAIPLIRNFSKSYDEYYKKLLIANEKYLETMK